MNTIKEIRSFQNNLQLFKLQIPTDFGKEQQQPIEPKSLDTTIKDQEDEEEEEYNESVVEHEVDVEEEMKRINSDRGNVFKLLSMSFYEKRKTPTPETRSAKRQQKSVPARKYELTANKRDSFPTSLRHSQQNFRLTSGKARDWKTEKASKKNADQDEVPMRCETEPCEMHQSSFVNNAPTSVIFGRLSPGHGQSAKQDSRYGKAVPSKVLPQPLGDVKLKKEAPVPASTTPRNGNGLQSNQNPKGLIMNKYAKKDNAAATSTIGSGGSNINNTTSSNKISKTSRLPAATITGSNKLASSLKKLKDIQNEHHLWNEGKSTKTLKLGIKQESSKLNSDTSEFAIGETNDISKKLLTKANTKVIGLFPDSKGDFSTSSSSAQKVDFAGRGSALYSAKKKDTPDSSSGRSQMSTAGSSRIRDSSEPSKKYGGGITGPAITSRESLPSKLTDVKAAFSSRKSMKTNNSEKAKHTVVFDSAQRVHTDMDDAPRTGSRIGSIKEINLYTLTNVEDGRGSTNRFRDSTLETSANDGSKIIWEKNDNNSSNNSKVAANNNKNNGNVITSTSASNLKSNQTNFKIMIQNMTSKGAVGGPLPTKGAGISSINKKKGRTNNYANTKSSTGTKFFKGKNPAETSKTDTSASTVRKAAPSNLISGGSKHIGAIQNKKAVTTTDETRVSWGTRSFVGNERSSLLSMNPSSPKSAFESKNSFKKNSGQSSKKSFKQAVENEKKGPQRPGSAMNNIHSKADKNKQNAKIPIQLGISIATDANGISEGVTANTPRENKISMMLSPKGGGGNLNATKEAIPSVEIQSKTQAKNKINDSQKFFKKN